MSSFELVGGLKEQSLTGSGTHFSCCQAHIARLVTLMFFELFAQPRPGLVQLRLRITYERPNVSAISLCSYP